MRILLVLIMASIGVSATAKTKYEGVTKNGEACFVTVALEDSNISFSSKRVGFGFIVNREAIDQSIRNGQTQITVKGGDATISAKLTLNLDTTGKVLSAQYKQRNFLLPKSVACQDMRELK